MVQSPPMRREPPPDLPQRVECRELREQHLDRNDPVRNPPVERFRKLLKGARRKGHGRPPRIMPRQHDFGKILGICRPSTSPHKQDPRQLSALRGDDEFYGGSDVIARRASCAASAALSRNCISGGRAPCIMSRRLTASRAPAI